MNFKTPCSLLVTFLLAGVCHAQTDDGSFWHGSGQHELPDGIRINLESDRTNYFLGENIVLYYHITNGASNAFKISVGGDYRGSTRPDRFKVRAVSADAKPVADPTPGMRNFGGGFMSGSEIRQGTNWYEHVHVIEYCRFDGPGIYDVHAFHDLGFGKKRAADSRDVSMTIRLQAPSEEQAEAILVADETAKPYYGSTWGQKGEVRLDWHCIRWPPYLKPLVKRAQAGKPEAVEGIASIRTLAATKALVDLLNHTNFSIARQAADFLEWRFPHATNEFQGPGGETKKAMCVENAWDTRFGEPLRNFSLQLLARTNHEDFILAAKYLVRVGSISNVADLLKAVDFATTQTNAEFAKDIHTPSPIRAADVLLGAAMTIDTNLNVTADKITSPSQALLFVARHNGASEEFGKAEEAAYPELLRHPLAYVRMKALESLPKPIPPSLTEAVTERMTDANAGVRGFAFEVAKRMQEPRHREIALEVLKAADDEWLRWSSQEIALKYGARYECAVAWCAHLVVPKDLNDYTSHDALRHLFELTTGRGANGGYDFHRDETYMAGLRRRWLKFLEVNKAKIAAGDKFHLSENMPSDLMPVGFGQ